MIKAFKKDIPEQKKNINQLQNNWFMFLGKSNECGLVIKSCQSILKIIEEELKGDDL